MKKQIWTKPYGIKEGFLVGGGLILAGLLLEMSVGPVQWGVFRWPVNAFVLTGFLCLAAVAFLMREKVYVLRFLGTYKATIPALTYVVVLTGVMGLTRQTENGVWFGNMLTFWPFVLIYAYVALILCITVLCRLHQMIKNRGIRINDIAFLLNHFGLFLAMSAATLGNADMQRLKMIAEQDVPEIRAVNQQGMIVRLPISIELKHFVIKTYDDGSPKYFASELQVRNKTGKSVRTTVEVNKPVKAAGWNIYQYGYDTEKGALSKFSILELVYDPWLPFVYAGVFMMLCGALCLFALGGRRKRL